MSNSTYYEDMKGDTECEKWDGKMGWFGAVMSLKVTGNNIL